MTLYLISFLFITSTHFFWNIVFNGLIFCGILSLLHIYIYIGLVMYNKYIIGLYFKINLHFNLFHRIENSCTAFIFAL